MSEVVKATGAAALFEKHLAALPHPSRVYRLVQFSHDSPGLRTYRREIAEALVMLLESNGFHVCNGLADAVELLREHGYTVALDDRTTVRTNSGPLENFPT